MNEFFLPIENGMEKSSETTKEKEIAVDLSDDVFREIL